MNPQQIAQELMEELQKELLQKRTETAQLEGAIHGVQLYFNKMIEGMQQAEGDQTVEDTKPPASKKTTGKK